MKRILTLATVMASATLTFAGNGTATTVNTGTYGICDEAKPSVGLTINEDNTFRYLNTTNKDKPVDVKDKWAQDDDTIVLSGFDKEVSVPNKWKIVGNEMCVKSKGFKNTQVVRLCLHEK